MCRNHIVWDAIDVAEVVRKHTANVGDALGDIRRAVEALVERRDERRDGFVKVVKKAMEASIGSDADEAMKVLGEQGVTQRLAKRAIEIAQKQGRPWTLLSHNDMAHLPVELRTGLPEVYPV